MYETKGGQTEIQTIRLTDRKEIATERDRQTYRKSDRQRRERDLD